jgi:23S rRNA (adenine2503-C2)-methyltransferase
MPSVPAGLAGLTEDELRAWVAARGEPGYRVQQILDGVWRQLASSVEEIATLPQGLRAALAADFRVNTIETTEVRLADGGLTEKALHRLADGALVESVLMHVPARPGRRERHTLCVSSQVGCAVGCPFCATGELGFGRDLEVAEICDQARWAARRLAEQGQRLTHVVFMGMGEPLLNLDRVLAAAAALTDPRRLGLADRHITISTSGVVPGIRRLTELRPQYTLAVSLHAARDPLRDLLVPLNRRWPVAEVVAAARGYAQATGRRVTYEVTLIDGLNDTPADADALADLLVGDLAHVNVIPMNPVAHTPWQPSPPDRVAAFVRRLSARGITVTVRHSRGVEIGAACGQLAGEQAGLPAPPAVERRRARLVAASRAALRAVGQEAGDRGRPGGLPAWARRGGEGAGRGGQGVGRSGGVARGGRPSGPGVGPAREGRQSSEEIGGDRRGRQERPPVLERRAAPATRRGRRG